jgi:hypothetical protein
MRPGLRFWRMVKAAANADTDGSRIRFGSSCSSRRRIAAKTPHSRYVPDDPGTAEDEGEENQADLLRVRLSHGTDATDQYPFEGSYQNRVNILLGTEAITNFSGSCTTSGPNEPRPPMGAR